MKIININSGLGNQMFQYAFIFNYKLRGCEVGLDILETNKLNYHNGYELGRIFGVKEKFISEEEKKKILGRIFYIRGIEFNFYKLFRKIIKTITLGKYVPIFNKYVQEDEMLKEYNFNPRYLEVPKDINSFFFGFFQSHKYFEKISNEVRKIFNFPQLADADVNNFTLLNEIVDSESVSIHVRRGDYLNLDNFNICDLSYYEKAINKMLSELQKREIYKINFFIFSDDVDWCRKNFDFLNNYKIHYVGWNKKENSYKDMQLMSKCKHNIIANSTFSWWGAWLNENPDKIVIVPKYWFKDILNSSDRCPNNWFRI